MVSRLAYTPVRHTHVITTFGPGALSITENGVSVLTCGPRTWLRSYRMERPTLAETIEELVIRDSHMEARLGVSRIVSPWPLSEDPSLKTDWLIPAVRFPLAEFCRNTECRRMHWSSSSDWKVGSCTACTTRRGKSPPTTQVPVVLACQSGHLSDVPWIQWLHAGAECLSPALRYRQYASPRRPTVECLTCKRSRTMSDEEAFACSGARPWLPGLPNEKCDQDARLVERSSTNIYYADTTASLAIPPVAAIIPALMRRLRTYPSLRNLRSVYTPGNELVLNQIASVCTSLGVPASPEEIAHHLEALKQEEMQAGETDEDALRSSELNALLSSRPRVRSRLGQPDLVVHPIDMACFGGSRLMSKISAVSVVPRVRVIEVLKGFSRLRAEPRSPADGYDQMWGSPRTEKDFDSGADWLPGYEVFGEGILIELDRNAWKRWVSETRESKRIRIHASPPERVLVHTLSHLVMQAAAPLSGFTLPSLRERIYDRDGRLAFLIFTTVGDIAGTMGGLSELGHPGKLERLIDNAVEIAQWCSTDPVCIESSPLAGLPSTTTTPGACNHCLLLPETSCERRNRDLDRAVVIGLTGENCGFFAPAQPPFSGPSTV